MFRKKKILRKYKFAYGKTPKSNKVVGYHRRKPIKKIHPFSRRIKKLSLLIIILLAAIFFIYLLTFSDIFIIKEIEIQNEESLTENLNDQLWDSIAEKSLGKNITFFDTEKLTESILQSFPEIEEIEIDKNYPHGLEVRFTEYELVANVINESDTLKKNYILNSIGYVIKEDLENPNLPYIKIRSDEPINPEEPVIEASKLKYITDSMEYFEDKFGMQVLEAQYKPIAREVHLLTEKNFYIWLDIQVGYEDQLKKLKKSLVKLDIYNENLMYIDLRLAGNNGDKIIYKRR